MMREITVCPSTLALGHNTYSPVAIKRLFDGKNASCHLYQLAPAYDLMNTSLHIEGDDLGLNGGLSEHIEKSDIYDRTGHPCRLDFERFGQLIGLRSKRISTILDQYAELPQKAEQLIANSFLNDKMKRTYIRIVKERIARFNRLSE